MNTYKTSGILYEKQKSAHQKPRSSLFLLLKMLCFFSVIPQAFSMDRRNERMPNLGAIRQPQTQERQQANLELNQFIQSFGQAPHLPLTQWQTLCLKEIWVRVKLRQLFAYFNNATAQLAEEKRTLKRTLFSQLKIKSFSFTRNQINKLESFINELPPVRNLRGEQANNLHQAYQEMGLELAHIAEIPSGLWTEDTNSTAKKEAQEGEIELISMNAFFQFLHHIVVGKAIHCLDTTLNRDGLAAQTNFRLLEDSVCERMNLCMNAETNIFRHTPRLAALASDYDSVAMLVIPFNRIYRKAAQNADFAKLEYALKNHMTQKQANFLMRKMCLQLTSMFVKSAKLACHSEKTNLANNVKNARMVETFTSAGIWYLISLHDSLVLEARLIQAPEIGASLAAPDIVNEEGFNRSAAELIRYNRFMPIKKVNTSRNSVIQYLFGNCKAQKDQQLQIASNNLNTEMQRINNLLREGPHENNFYIKEKLSCTIPGNLFKCKTQILFGVPYIFADDMTLDVKGDIPLLPKYSAGDIHVGNIRLFFNRKILSQEILDNFSEFTPTQAVMITDDLEIQYMQRLKQAGLLSEKSSSWPTKNLDALSELSENERLLILLEPPHPVLALGNP
jgi:hypothetical protein